MNKRTYGTKRDFPKIEIYRQGHYVCSTTWAKTCKEARARFLSVRSYETPGAITARFAK